MSAITTVGVIVPARNEQADIGRCLDAIAVATSRLIKGAGEAVRVRIVVVLDSCTDRTETVADRPGVERVVVEAGCVGTARAAGAAFLLAGAARPEQIWLANTDADSSVPADWLAEMVAAADRGVGVVLGTVIPAVGLDHRTLRAWHDRHDLREGHRHVHGANFGIRGDVYRSLGGWPALTSGEDEVLAARALACPSVQVVRTAAIPVCTSSRLAGRAPDGFASYLHALAARPRPSVLLPEIS